MQDERIKALQQKVNKLAEDAYWAGIDGGAGYPMDVDKEIAAFGNFMGRKPSNIGYQAIMYIISQCNQAFERGCRERTARTASTADIGLKEAVHNGN